MKQTLQAIFKNKFLQDSGFLSIVSLIVGLVNYLLILLASKILGSQFELWTLINSLTVVLGSIFSGISTEIVKKSAKLKQDNLDQSFDYYRFIRGRFGYITLGIFLFIPILVWPLGQMLKVQDLGLLAITLLNIILSLTVTINAQFLLGVLNIRLYSFNNLFGAILRFLLVFFLVQTWQNVWALPLGSLIASITTFLVTEYLINRSYTQKTLETSEMEIIKKQSFSLKDEVLAMGQSGLITFFMTAFLNLTSVFLRNFFAPNSYEANLFANIFVFGNLIFFGSMALLTGFLPHASGRQHRKVYLVGCSIGFGCAVLGGLSFLLFGSFLMKFLNKSEIIKDLPLIVWYAFFVGFYNIIFLSVQYLLARNRYKIAYAIIFWTIILGISLFLTEKTNFDFSTIGKFLTGINSENLSKNVSSADNSVLNIILTNLVVAASCAVYFFVRILNLKKVDK